MRRRCSQSAGSAHQRAARDRASPTSASSDLQDDAVCAQPIPRAEQRRRRLTCRSPRSHPQEDSCRAPSRAPRQLPPTAKQLQRLSRRCISRAVHRGARPQLHRTHREHTHSRPPCQEIDHPLRKNLASEQTHGISGDIPCIHGEQKQEVFGWYLDLFRPVIKICHVGKEEELAMNRIGASGLQHQMDVVSSRKGRCPLIPSYAT